MKYFILYLYLHNASILLEKQTFLGTNNKCVQYLVCYDTQPSKRKSGLRCTSKLSANVMKCVCVCVGGG